MGNNLKTIIIDDDAVATEQLKVELSKYPVFNICGNACTGAEGRNLLLDINPDLIFLDVELPDCLGFEFLHSIRYLLKEECHVIFFTAYNRYMIKALREKAFDYLLKPIDPNELAIITGRILEDKTIQKRETDKEEENDNVSVLLDTAKGDILIINSNDISYFSYEEKSRYWIAFLCNGDKYALKRTTKADRLLNFSDDLKMPDKSHIINIHSLAVIKDGHCIMKPPFENVRDITIGKTKMQKLRKAYPNI